MTPSLTQPSQRPPDKQTVASPLGSIQWIWRDRVLRPAFLLCALLISYQLAVTLAQPPWIGPVTDWLRATLACPVRRGGRASRDAGQRAAHLLAGQRGSLGVSAKM
ncbi:MAG TPA: hypothetical protein VF916_03380 [Ktedonobacterales bacterium]